MWPFHYLLPTAKFLSSNYKKARSPPPGRQLLPPRPRTLNSSRFCTAGWGRQHKRQILCWRSQREGQHWGSSVPLPALEVRMSQRGQPIAPFSTHIPLCSALPCVGLPPTALPWYSIPFPCACAWPPLSNLHHLFLPQAVSPFLTSNRASNFSSPRQVLVQSLVLHLTA